MDFTFRAICHREKTCLSGSQSSNYTYLNQQAIQYYFERYYGGGYGHFPENRDMVMMERELEKERIRGYILAEEAARRRRVLEAEVRRELREERVLREVRWRGSVQCESYQRATFVETRSFEKRFALPLQEGMYDVPRLEQPKVGGYEEELPFQRAPQRKVGGSEEELPFQRAPQAVKSVVKKGPDVYSSNHSDVLKADEEKKQIIFLAKPEANRSGKKRKDTASPLEGPSEVTNKLTKEWSCALCQISATSKMGLEDHLKGKKHKSKLAGRKVGMIGLGLEKITNPLDKNQVGQSNVGLEKSQQTSSRNETDVKNNKMGIVKKIKYGGEVQMAPKKKKMKFNFYCKLCKVGAFHEEVMNDHKKGKKHLLRLQRRDD